MNPWLNIPLADYEAHMAMPGVGQAQLLSEIFAGALKKYSPGSVAVLGCAGGNGFDHLIPSPEMRVMGIDLNPDYVQQAGVRYTHLLPRLELIVGDIETVEFSFPPVDLVFAGLIFEYLDVDRTLRNIHPILSRDGALVVVLQLPSEAVESVTPSPYVSLGVLKDCMSLVHPEKFISMAQSVGLRTKGKRIWKAAGGKEFVALDLYPSHTKGDG